MSVSSASQRLISQQPEVFQAALFDLAISPLTDVVPVQVAGNTIYLRKQEYDAACQHMHLTESRVNPLNVMTGPVAFMVCEYMREQTHLSPATTPLSSPMTGADVKEYAARSRSAVEFEAKVAVHTKVDPRFYVDYPSFDELDRLEMAFLNLSSSVAEPKLTSALTELALRLGIPKAEINEGSDLFELIRTEMVQALVAFCPHLAGGTEFLTTQKNRFSANSVPLGRAIDHWIRNLDLTDAVIEHSIRDVWRDAWKNQAIAREIEFRGIQARHLPNAIVEFLKKIDRRFSDTGFALIFDEMPTVDLSPLRHLQNISKLSTGNCPLKDIAFVRNFKRLEFLSIQSSQPVNFDPLEGLSSLRTLEVSSEILPCTRQLKNPKIEIRAPREPTTIA